MDVREKQSSEKRLIDANSLLRHKRKMSGADFGGEFWDARRIYTNGSKLIPSFRVKQMMEHYAPVRHGRWDDEHKCTVCHNEAFFKISDIRPDYDYDWEENLVETGNYIWDTEWIETAYCPSCGAKMDGVEAR